MMATAMSIESTADLDGLREVARSAPALEYGFPGTVLISVNDEIVHGIPGPRILASGDLVSLDVTLEKGGYVADAARSVVVGAGHAVAHRLVEAARAAFEAGQAVVRAGTKVNAIGGAVRGLAGHGVGRKIHEEPSVPNHYDRWQRDVLTEGMVITIEPMLSAGSATPVQNADGWTLRTADRSLAAHFEHTIVITRGAPLVLTAA